MGVVGKLGRSHEAAFYFTELMGLAFGLPGTNKWWS
jgi:hypothetical protein